MCERLGMLPFSVLFDRSIDGRKALATSLSGVSRVSFLGTAKPGVGWEGGGGICSAKA